jgi:hypothetical protein
MNLRFVLLLAAGSLLMGACEKNNERPVGPDAEPVVWHLDNLQNIGGHEVTVEGDPKVVDTPNGKAIEFDGIDDGIFLDVNPLAGMSAFTVEVIFNPYAGGAAEQRFFHMQPDWSESRVMFETRLVEADFWFLDTFVKSGEQNVTHFADDHLHETATWFHAAIVVDGKSFTHYVNGERERSAPLQYEVQKSGKTSLGVRMNKVHWFKGAIRTVRVSPRALSPEEFLTAGD